MVRLGSIAQIINGDRSSNYPSGDDFQDMGVPFINAGHLQNGKVDYSSMDYISHEKYNQLSGAKIQRNDILLCLRGSLGKYALVTADGGAPASSIAVIRAYVPFLSLTIS
jgi:type I restriction enzyme S subunit